MKNSILKYSTEEVDNFIVTDYQSKKVTINDLFEKANTLGYLSYYKINDNDKLERISYELYGTTDYWDLLFLLNNKNPLFDMPYYFDTIMSESSEKSSTYISTLYQGSTNFSIRAEELTNTFLNKDIETNNNNKTIFVIKPTQMSNFIKLIIDNGYL